MSEEHATLPPPPQKKNGRGGWGIVVLKIIRKNYQNAVM